MEASLSMVLFTFVMIALLSVINVCRVQAVLANAMDLTALEISQYSYLYQVLGIRSGVEGMNDAASSANKNIYGVVMGADEILYGVETMFTLLEEPTNAPKIVGEAKGYIEKGIDGISIEIDAIIESPKQFFLSFGALAISAGIDEVEKKLVKLMCVSHIGNGQYSKNKMEDADKLLKTLGVKGGVSGLDFRLTNLFDGEGRQDVNLVVMYEAKLFSPFPWLEKEFVQSASTRAWLSGDELYVYADKPKEEIESSEELESSEEIESSEELETQEDENTKYWEQSNIKRGNAAKEDFRQSYPSADMTPSNKNEKFVGFDEDTYSLYGINTVDTCSPSYVDKDGNFNDFSKTKVRKYAMERLELASKLMKEYENSKPPVTITFRVQEGLGNSPNGPL